MKIQNYTENKSFTQKSPAKETALQRWKASYDAIRKKIYLEILEIGKQGNKQ